MMTPSLVKCVFWIAIATLVGCKGNTQTTQPAPSAFEIAKDPKVYWADRIAAARQLNETERAQLQALFLSQLPGRVDKATIDTITVLGEIGDEEAATKLEVVSKIPIDEDGKYPGAVRNALAKIRARTGTTTHGAETKP